MEEKLFEPNDKSLERMAPIFLNHCYGRIVPICPEFQGIPAQECRDESTAMSV
jgi:hypothetical protein